MDVYAAIEVEEFRNSPAPLADDAGAMALIYHHEGVVLLCQVADFVHGGDVAVHGEDAVCYDDAEALGLGLLEALLQFCHVCVGVTVAYGLAEAHAVYDGCVVEGVGDDGVFCRKERLEDTAVCVEAGGVKDGVFRMEVCRYCFFQLAVKVLLAADEADGRHAVAALVHGLLGGRYEAGVV